MYFSTVTNLFLLFFHVVWRRLINFLKILFNQYCVKYTVLLQQMFIFYPLDIPNNNILPLLVVQIDKQCVNYVF